MTKFLFAERYSFVACSFAGAVTHFLLSGRYVAAAVSFAIGVALTMWGDLRLEKQGRPS